MQKQTLRLRPDVDAFPCLGGRVGMVDVDAVLRDAGREPTRLLHEAGWPAPVEAISLSVRSDTTDGRPLHLLKAEIRTAGGAGERALPGPGTVASSVALVAGGLR